MKMGRIVSIGECMGELSETGSPGMLSMGFAGDTLNTAYYLRHSLGQDWQVDYVSAVGTDGLSDRMVDFLNSEGIGTDHVRRLADKTIGLYYITLKDGERSFTYWRNDSAAKRLASDPGALNRALEGADLAYWSGITLAILSNQDRLALIEALGQFAGKGGTVVFDPNLRPRLWDNPETMRGWVHRAAAVSDLCLPSFEDEATWFGDADPAATAKRYQAEGARRVIVKNGSEDVTFAGSSGELSRFSIPSVEHVVDTTAAGDSFNAGYLAAELNGASVENAVAAGARLAGRVIGARGALVPDAVTQA
ncbi:MAG: sugar kinase [Alphaproteobacteria bacterium]|uniref:sugar kinase n=1 Tax=unclassified Rhizobium TaxID=2613769 RepID=UPI0006B9ECBB|nr:sugar kinase [Rhizobium sp. AAP116]MBU0739487.1 sugar kinase [Alphaproteobacteria bacterium]MDM7979327.1 sugar kinase [Rhizobium sp.]KPF59288.1 2-dehydro-3-deoxygluconokinase [Rhizobium sp. AAP116]MBU0834557.1 sugar kinase [Alphaproteobacteria bacterium]MBU1763250.1 sugar kinase [Alphaproteobacteria bacterium]